MKEALNITKDAAAILRAVDLAIKGVIEHPKDYGGQVGCVLLSPYGEIVSEAFNSIVEGERKHAEEIVLAQASGLDLSDHTMYITAEPCNGNPYHTRKHCCEQIADSGINRVVLGSSKRVYSGGADFLRRNRVRIDFLENTTLDILCSNLISINAKSEDITPAALRKLGRLRNDVLLRGY